MVISKGFLGSDPKSTPVERVRFHIWNTHTPTQMHLIFFLILLFSVDPIVLWLKTVSDFFWKSFICRFKVQFRFSQFPFFFWNCQETLEWRTQSSPRPEVVRHAARFCSHPGFGDCICPLPDSLSPKRHTPPPPQPQSHKRWKFVNSDPGIRRHKLTQFCFLLHPPHEWKQKDNWLWTPQDDQYQSQCKFDMATPLQPELPAISLSHCLKRNPVQGWGSNEAICVA